MVDNNLPVQVTLTVEQLNQALLIIAEKPLKDVLHLYLALRQQGDEAIKRSQTPEA